MKRFTIYYFSTAMRYASVLVFGLAAFLAMRSNPVCAVALLVCGLVILTTRYITEIDMQRRQYRDYLYFLGIPLQQEKVTFRSVDKIIISKERQSQMLNTRSRSRQLDWATFTATLIVDGGRPLDLLTRTERVALVRGIRDIAGFLDVPVEDHTTAQAFTVRMEQTSALVASRFAFGLPDGDEARIQLAVVPGESGFLNRSMV